MIADLFIKILNLSIGAVPIMAVLLVLRLLFKKAVPRKVFYIAWALVFLRLMVPFSIESDFSFFNHVPKADVIEENIGTSVVFIENEKENIEFPVYINPEKENPNVDWVYHSAITGEVVTGPDITTVPMDRNMIFGTVWIFGTAGLLLFGIIGYFAVLKKTNFESVPYTKNIRLSDFFKTPIVCGLFQPKIILPMNFDLDDKAKVESVIAHECTHIRRGDNFWRLLASFTLYVHWFNPLVWICYNAFIRDMEVSCDEEVLAKAKKDIRAEYAESLVALSGSGTNPLYGGVLSFGESGIKERVKCIMNFKKATVFILIICAMAALALGVIFLTNPSMKETSKYYEISMEKSEALIFDKEKGVDVSAKIRNISDVPIYVYPEIELYFYEGDTWMFFGNYYPSEGTVVLTPGEDGVLCGNLNPEVFVGVPEISGKYKLIRQISKDAGNSQVIDFVEFFFEIKEEKTFINSLANADRKGDIVTLGNYYGEIEWLVLDVKDDNLLLITLDCIDALPYNNERKKLTWENSDIRKWLNEDFIEMAFSEEEQNLILTTELENPDNKRFGGAIGGNNTQDKVFLLSHDEVLEYFPNGWNIYSEPTAKAEENLEKYESGGREYWWWWTRSPGLGQDMATIVNGVTLGVGDDGLVVSEKHGIRPAMWINKNGEIEYIFYPNGEVEEEEANTAIGSGINEKTGNSENTSENEVVSGAKPIATDDYYKIQANLYRNSDKTYVPSMQTKRISGFFELYNWAEAEDKSVLGNPIEGVDVLELSRERDGKKYTLELYEKGFVLSGSAVADEYNRKAWLCEGDEWNNLIADINDEYSDANELYPYWFGLINIKNVSFVIVRETQRSGDSVKYISNNSFEKEDDCMNEFVERLRFMTVIASEKITNAKREEILEKEDKYVYALLMFENGTTYEIYFTNEEVLVFSSGMTYGLRYVPKENVNPYDDFLDFSMEGGLQNPMTGKPVIYLYPEKETKVSVNLDFDGKLTYTYPALNNGWNVLAKPDGTLTNLADGSTHYYLFWEGTARPKWTYKKGFVVKGSETESFLRENLAKMGLTPREYNDFITYWVPKMQENPYNLISFSGDEYSKIAKLTVNPKPDTMIRIHMVWKALDKPIEIEPQVLPVYKREGFTLVEWGGTEIY